jgi:hypothetical protein
MTGLYIVNKIKRIYLVYISIDIYSKKFYNYINDIYKRGI